MEKTIDERNKVTPEKISEILSAHMSTGALVTGVDLEVYTHIKNGHSTAAEIAKAAQASPRGMEILLNGLVALNFLTKSNDTYHLTPVAEKFLVKDSPTYLGDWVQTADMNRKDFMHLTEVVRTGKPYLRTEQEQEEGEEYFKKLDPGIFQATYPWAKAAAEALGVGKTWKNLEVFDVGAGSGAWSIAFAELDAGTEVTALDLPGILEITRKFVDRFGLNERFSYLPGDMRKIDFGREKYDLVILGQICHMLGVETNRSLFSRIHRSLKRGGRLLISSFIPDDERSSAVFPLLFAAMELIVTTEGNTYTMKEYREWLQGAGFRSIATIDAPGPSPLIIANK
ncbi:MAG TPA: class I SAM-dependent methyltransferase [Candidatus Methanoperedens sp.]